MNYTHFKYSEYFFVSGEKEKWNEYSSKETKKGLRMSNWTPLECLSEICRVLLSSFIFTVQGI